MNTPLHDPARVPRQAQALMDLVEADCRQQCALALGEAQRRAAAVRSQAQADARARLGQAFAGQRARRDEAIAAAQARLATQRRLHAQQRTAALLRLAWDQLPAELRRLWQQPATRAAWVAHVLSSARAHMPQGGWHIVHAVDWPAPEQQALAGRLAGDSGSAPQFEPDPAIAAGLKVVAGGNVIDGTLGGLLADRAEFEARLLRRLEDTP